MIFLSFFFSFFGVKLIWDICCAVLSLILSEKTGIFGPSEDHSPNAFEKCALHGLWTMASIIRPDLSNFGSKATPLKSSFRPRKPLYN